MATDSAMLPAIPGPKDTPMPKRYRYDRMTPEDLGRDLNALQLTPNDFARITGAKYERVVAWLATGSRHEDIPPWVPVMTALLALPGGVAKAVEVMQFYIRDGGGDDDA